MTIRNILLVLVVWCLSTSRHGFGESTLSREEDLELEKELKRLNKPGVKTIKTKFGDTYTCVEFHKQPAFDHPALKNVNIKLFRPTSYPKGFRKQDSSSKANRTRFAGMLWVNGKGCPSGTVPIKKMTKEDLIGAKLANQIMSSGIHPETEQNRGYHYAILRTNDITRRLHGAEMITTVYNPSAVGDQFSKGYLEIRNGDERISTGWMVNPKLYKDNRTRGFTYTSAGQSRCFNTLCPGLVSSMPDLPVDMVFSETSVVHTKVVEAKFSIFQDKGNKNWFLYHPLSGDIIAFWPHQIFKRLNSGGNYAEWGGAVYSPPGEASPPMGSGEKVSEKASYDAYSKNIVLSNQDYEIEGADYTTTFMDIRGVYQIVYEGTFGPNGYWIYWGGKGGYYGPALK